MFLTEADDNDLIIIACLTYFLYLLEFLVTASLLYRLFVNTGSYK